MSRLRIRNEKNTRWLDICQSEWRVRNPANTAWMRLMPAAGIKVRHGSENYWLDVDCISEVNDGCTEDEYGGTPDGKGANGSGPQNPNAGGVGSGDPSTGNGSGSDGGSGGSGSGSGGTGNDNTGGTGGSSAGANSPGNADFSNGDAGSSAGGAGDSSCAQGSYAAGQPYPAGFDLPDGCGDGAGLKNGGSCIYRPGLDTCEPYKQPDMPNADCGGKKAGSFDCPLQCPNSAFGNGAGVWEFYADLGTVSGPVKFSWQAAIGSISVDIYYDGKRVATTGGQRTGHDKLEWNHTPTTDGKVFVRVRSTNSATRWTLAFKCPNDDEDGTLDNPRPCTGTYDVRKNKGEGVFEYYHQMGKTAGQVVIDYQMWSQPDKLEVFQSGKLIATTGGYVSNEGTLKFNYSNDGSEMVMVRITARDPGTSWAYQIGCPGQKGNKSNPKNCADGGTVYSGGAGVTDTFIDMGAQAGNVSLRYNMWNVPDKLDVYQSGTLIATTGVVTGDHVLQFRFDPGRGTVLQVRVTGAGKTIWAFLLQCAEPDRSVFSIDNPSVKEGNGESVMLNFTVRIDSAKPTPQTVDYSTANGSGAANVDYRPVGGKLTIPAGQTSALISVPVIGNTTKQGNRTVLVNLSNPTGSLANSQGTGTIIDDDSTLCNQNPQQAVHESTGGPDGGMVLYVQDRMDCAAGNTMYLMQAYITFANSGPHVFNFVNDDDFEFYIDCQKVAEGPIGTATATINVNAGTRNLILRYKNVPDCTPGYAGFNARFNNQIVYSTRASDWKGQPNSIGEIS